VSTQVEVTPAIGASVEPAGASSDRGPAAVEPGPREPRWWPTFIGNFLAIAMMLSLLFLPVILLLMVALTAFVIHHIN
jgi:hypothetical protein